MRIEIAEPFGNEEAEDAIPEKFKTLVVRAAQPLPK
jgi:hypothetical protein